MVMQIEKLARQARAHQQPETANLLDGLAKNARKAGIPNELTADIPQEIERLAAQLGKYPKIADALFDTAKVSEIEIQDSQKRNNAYTRSREIQEKYSVKINTK